MANDRRAVSRHAFFPFLRFTESWLPFRGERSDVPPKKRPIRYSARRDAAIFAKYRAELATLYEEELKRHDLGNVVIAYRRLKTDEGKGKTNVHFAREAFSTIRNLGNCRVYVVDISKFFESLDHTYLAQRWLQTIGKESFPPDHYNVFKAVTCYAVVDAEPLFERLGLRFTAKDSKDNIRKIKEKRRDRRKSGHLQLCSKSQFLDLVCGKGGAHPSLIQRHRLPYGIPQGLPISDILANMYLLDFDKKIANYALSRGGVYQRYCDDIIIIVPEEKRDPSLISVLRGELQTVGSQLTIQDKKVSEVAYFLSTSGVAGFRHVNGKGGKNGTEYLGFRFDGQRVFIRDRTIANLHRKFLRRSRGAIAAHVRRYRGKSGDWLRGNFDSPTILKGFVAQVRFSEVDDPSDWTFFSYVRGAREIFADFETRFLAQLGGFKAWARDRIAVELDKRIAKR